MKKTKRQHRLFRYFFLGILMITLLPFQLHAAKDRVAPSTPTGLQATGITHTSIDLKWNPSTDNVSVPTYQVYQNNVLISTISTTSYSALGLVANTSYTFTVRAKDNAGNVSALSQPLRVTTLAEPVMETVSSPAPETTTTTTNPTTTVTTTTTATTSPAKALIGYYAGWATYSGKQVADLDASKLTHINYAFANIGTDLKIALGDSYADVEKKFTGDLSTDPYFGNFNQLRKLKLKHPHLKTFISVGGWSWSGKFSDIALTDASRTVFADSAVAFIVKYGFDGVDIDWEYPVSGGLASNVRRPEDKQNFTLLMQKLREKLDARGAADGKSYLLSFAGAAGSFYTNNVELAKLQQYCNFVNIMSYDIHGTWESKTGFNAPLYKDPASGNTYDIGVHDAVQLYVNQGVPASKLVMGVPFYGYRYDNVTNANNGLYQSFSGGASVTYADVVAKYLGQGYVRYYNEASKVPYLFNGSSFITYEDPQSMGAKAAYVKAQSLAGAMVWELSQDTSTKELLTTLYQGLQ